MVTPSIIYWIATLDKIITASTLIGGITFIGGIIGVMMISFAKAEQDDDMLRESRYVNIVAWPIAILACSISVFAPSSRTVAAMYVVPAIVNNEKVQDIGNKMYDLAIEWMEELKPRSNKKSGE